jgi:hypothetical protein
MQVTDKEKSIVRRVLNQEMLMRMAGKADIEVEDVYVPEVGQEKTEELQKLISTCRYMLEEEFEELKEILDKD